MALKEKRKVPKGATKTGSTKNLNFYVKNGERFVVKKKKTTKKR